jgi:hypothetical protein
MRSSTRVLGPATPPVHKGSRSHTGCACVPWHTRAMPFSWTPTGAPRDMRRVSVCACVHVCVCGLCAHVYACMCVHVQEHHWEGLWTSPTVSPRTRIVAAAIGVSPARPSPAAGVPASLSRNTTLDPGHGWAPCANKHGEGVTCMSQRGGRRTVAHGVCTHHEGGGGGGCKAPRSPQAAPPPLPHRCTHTSLPAGRPGVEGDASSPRDPSAPG